MIGFFEHQYLAYKKNHIKNLLALAKADGHLHEEETKLLFKIGDRYGLKERQVQSLIDSKKKFEINIPDNHVDRMSLLYDLVLMVYADGKVDDSEIEFCEDVVDRFGMKKQMVKWLLSEFDRGTPPPPDEWDEMVKVAKEKFMKK